MAARRGLRVNNQESTRAIRASRSLAPTLWVILALTAIAVAHYAIIVPGNTLGEDEWPYIYGVMHQHSLQYIGDRPAEMIYQTAAFWLAGANPYRVQAVLIALTVA